MKVKAVVGRLSSRDLARKTELLTLAYFGHIMMLDFILKWIPKNVVDMGSAPSLTGSVLLWAYVGGATGAIIFGLPTQRFGMRGLLMSVLAMATVLVIIYGRGQADLTQMSIIAGLLFHAGYGLQILALGMALGSAVAAVAVFFLPAARVNLHLEKG